ncbi:MAG: DNA repair protein RecO [Betaproteobacteria bacterium]|nr:DNA repair protein RecO [Betaproteobacteria bacterium]
MAAGKSTRYKDQAGYVLHSYPYQETSLIVEVFTREFGRVAMVAKGAKRAHSPLRSVLMPFHALTLDWSGRSELKTLRSAEWRGAFRLLVGRALICGFYLNELLLKLLHRDDPHDALFDAYERTLQTLLDGADQAVALRCFEKRLLAELGYALILDHDAQTHEPLQARRQYHYIADRGPVALGVRDNPGGLELLGQTLIDMHNDDYSAPLTQQQSKSLMRRLIGHYLGNQTLHSRQLLMDLQDL